MYCVGGQWNSLQHFIYENILYLHLSTADVWQNCLFKSGSNNATHTFFSSPIYPSHLGKWRNQIFCQLYFNAIFFCFRLIGAQSVMVLNKLLSNAMKAVERQGIPFSDSTAVALYECYGLSNVTSGCLVLPSKDLSVTVPTATKFNRCGHRNILSPYTKILCLE